ncbi:SDR family NAD(P)-dependent oxidoreductase [Martelella radicis]|uniref:NAD(P)-dependent dehydrogenase (Short-subunit alcohol dehydrogenase family) n=1 Tax=Martelella radicis TaxID=1397476 RepID=A0A7W6KGZ3_9HYPH|nr:SDR family oxidoreductase [Martelella radicis]MBB4120898.1 NAD(P)-dependent dehydrogenase (short-subunit alcohol dehydrogenase family) [Martelella radicis]
MRLKNKIAVITGGSTGIGLASAKRFAAEGATVYITGRRQAALDAAVAEIGHGARAIQGDVAKLDELDRIYATIDDEVGRIDILFANAGVGDVAPLGSITPEQFDHAFGINVRGMVFTVQKGLPLMNAGGTIILTGSTTGIMGTPAFSVYSATKAAIRNFARSWALDLKGTGIRVNVLSPGSTQTPGLEGVASSAGVEKEAMFAAFAEQTPLGRVADASEIAAAAMLLASDDSSFMTGSEVFVDGGLAQV